MFKQFERSRRTGGTILIVTMWVVLVLAGLALVFARSMRVAAIVAANHVASLEAECVVAGAAEYAMAKLIASEEEETSVLMDSEPYEAMQVGKGYFWLLRPNLQDDREFDYGLTDEAGKINLNSASQEMLLRLPGMTAELAASIIDWRDENSEITPGGAEDEYYLLLPEPYNCKNAPLETVDEILLIKGASEELLYGEDTNLNSILDGYENDGDLSDPPDNRNGRLDTGFYDYVTVYSVETNLDSEGNQRININDPRSREDLQSTLQEIVKEDRALEIMNLVPTNPSFSNVLGFYFSTGLKHEEFSQIVDRLTTSDERALPGLVNVNTAPKAVLLCLPGLEESDAEALLSHRSSGEGLDTIAWVAEVLERNKAVAVGSYITTRSFQYSADVVSIAGNGRAYKRYKAVFDMSQEKPQVVYWKSMTHFGWPLNQEIVAALRKGQPLTNTILSMN
ncbi:MAG TPA: helix-hairpin-helix domain-containing protein [Sedimentisphaerales bacterium]|nr:helix-hairpin-helix domain-containing protein [Sedimentisphaerales bacterium]